MSNTKPRTSFRHSAATRAQLDQLMAHRGETATEVIAAAIATLWHNTHTAMHHEQSYQSQTAVCPWCGYTTKREEQ